MKFLSLFIPMMVLATSAAQSANEPKEPVPSKQVVAPSKASKTQPPPGKTNVGASEKQKQDQHAKRISECRVDCQRESWKKFPPTGAVIGGANDKQRKDYVRNCQANCI